MEYKMDFQWDRHKNKLFLVFRELLKTRPEPTGCGRGRIPSPSLEKETNQLSQSTVDQAVAVQQKV